MSSPAPELLYRSLPSVDELLRGESGAAWLREFPRALAVNEIRRAIQTVRTEIAEGRWDEPPPYAAAVEAMVTRALDALRRPSLQRVINAAGVILHTNLGRAPLSDSAVEAVARTAAGYSNLEYDLATGRRGKRDVHAGELLERLLGAPAIVVNNNAAAIYLILNELASDGETIVSRGELIEIGDGFRIPDILERSGTRLREVGTTNRTRLDDYRRAISPDTRVLLRVHPSNFRIEGFTARPALDELAELAREARLPLVEDLGSGCFYDLAQQGLGAEPPAAASLAAGADLACFSGDKLLGGPQAGIIAGREELVGRIRRNPMFRALRADKMTYAALEATLRDVLFERWDQVPTLRMIRAPVEEIRVRAERLAAALHVKTEVVAVEAALGGGSTPAQTLASFAVAIDPPAGLSAAKLEGRLRAGDPAVVARVEGERVLLDLRSVFPEQDEALGQAVDAALASLTHFPLDTC